MFSIKTLQHSINEAENELICWELQYPRIIHAEMLTHRVFSRNSASSRAIPLQTMIKNVSNDPFIPHHWGANEKGMQAHSEISQDKQVLAEAAIRKHLATSIDLVNYLDDLGLHKQVGNRYLEPWMYITVILSTTSIAHFKALRVDAAAEPHFQKIAGMMCDTYAQSTPKFLKPGEWHLPLTGFDNDADLDINHLTMLSTARCARVSYLTHEGIRDVKADIDLHNRLASQGHWSPFEHPAVACATPERHGNFTGFKQYRKFFPTEYLVD